jgi:hypothetical protein
MVIGALKKARAFLCLIDGWYGWMGEEAHGKVIGGMDEGMRLIERKIPLHIYLFD